MKHITQLKGTVALPLRYNYTHSATATATGSLCT